MKNEKWDQISKMSAITVYTAAPICIVYVWASGVAIIAAIVLTLFSLVCLLLVSGVVVLYSDNSETKRPKSETKTPRIEIIDDDHIPAVDTELPDIKQLVGDMQQLSNECESLRGRIQDTICIINEQPRTRRRVKRTTPHYKRRPAVRHG